MKKEKIILKTSEEAAKLVTVSGWVDIHGRFWGKDEQAARFSSHTHSTCECGELAKKPYTKCEECRLKEDIERYNQYPFQEWDGITPLFDDNTDRYFTDPDEIIDYYEENYLELSDLRLVICEPNKYNEVEEDYWESVMAEDQEYLPKELTDALGVFNNVIKSLPPASYSPGKKRTSIEIKTEKE